MEDGIMLITETDHAHIAIYKLMAKNLTIEMSLSWKCSYIYANTTL